MGVRVGVAPCGNELALREISLWPFRSAIKLLKVIFKDFNILRIFTGANDPNAGFVAFFDVLIGV